MTFLFKIIKKVIGIIKRTTWHRIVNGCVNAVENSAVFKISVRSR